MLVLAGQLHRSTHKSISIAKMTSTFGVSTAIWVTSAKLCRAQNLSNKRKRMHVRYTQLIAHLARMPIGCEMASHPNRGLKGPFSNPTPAEILAARNAAGLTQTEAGMMVKSSLRAWQQWESGDRRMHPGLWELFLIRTTYVKLPS